MKKFLIKVTIYSLSIVILFFAVFYSVYKISQANSIIVLPKKHYEMVFIGNSQIQRSLNDSIIKNSINLGSMAEYYLFSKAKLEGLNSNGIQYENLFIEFGEATVNKHFESDVTSKGLLAFRMSTYFGLLKMSDLSYLFLKAPESTIFNMTSTLRDKIDMKLFYKQNIYESNSFGKFVSSNNHFNKSDYQRHRDTIQPWKGLYIDNINHLKEIIKSSGAKKKTFLIASPTHKLFPGRQNWHHIKKTHQCFFNEVPFLDFSHLNLPDSCFADVNHLNESGSTLFSNILNELILKGLLSSPCPERIVSEYLSKLNF